ncbi:SLC13 family permease [Gammaproteobacteria bacterium]
MNLYSKILQAEGLMLALTTEMVIVLAFLVLTMYLFISEVVRVDVAAIFIMVLLGLISFIWPKISGGHIILESKNLFSGFSSNAVISIIAVMIIGAGLDKTGLMTRLADQIIKIGGTTERRIILLISGTAAFISSFMQNIGAAALLLPVVSRISNRTEIPMSQLLLPMGFCAIMGGNMTMIGSSSLILLNDLILNSNKTLPSQMPPMEIFHLFDVAPVGLLIVTAGILYFFLVGHYILPVHKTEGTKASRTGDYLRRIYGIEGEIFEIIVTHKSSLVNATVEMIETLTNHNLLIIGSKTVDGIRIAPARDIVIHGGSTLAVLGLKADLVSFAREKKLVLVDKLTIFADELSHAQAGIGELVIPPGSRLVGKSLMDIRMRKTYGFNVIAVHRGALTIRQGLRNLVLQSGDTFVVHTTWKDLAVSEQDRNFIVVTTDYPHEKLRPHKSIYALTFCVTALALVLFTDIRLSLALFFGAVGMILNGVLTIDEAYDAINWKSIFLLASLLPLGLAVETTGMAAWIAQETLNVFNGVPVWVLQAAIAVLATIFTILMSTAAATVLLVPLAVNIAVGVQVDPRIFALTVALSTSNSFFLPTHQVNALLMGPGGYRVKDYMRAGGAMTILYLVVELLALNIIYSPSVIK